MKRRDNYWLRGTEKGDWNDSVILFRIDSYPLTRGPYSGQVVQLQWNDLTIVGESFKVANRDYFRKALYTVEALRTVWEDLVKTGYWTPTTQPTTLSRVFFDPFRDMEP